MRTDESANVGIPANVGLVVRSVTNPFNPTARTEYWFIVCWTNTGMEMIPIASTSTVARLKRAGYPVLSEKELLIRNLV